MKANDLTIAKVLMKKSSSFFQDDSTITGDYVLVCVTSTASYPVYVFYRREIWDKQKNEVPISLEEIRTNDPGYLLDVLTSDRTVFLTCDAPTEPVKNADEIIDQLCFQHSVINA